MMTSAWLLAAWLGASLAFAGPAQVGGEWNATLEFESFKGNVVLTFKQDGEKLTGTYKGRYGTFALEGTVKGQQVEFSVAMTAEGMETQGLFAGTVDGDTISGVVEFEGAGQGSWHATRTASKQ
jgi:hypothetical protein